jgi:integrase
MAQFAIETGLRQANVLGLTWSRVDLARKLVWVEAEDTKGDAAIAIPLSTGALHVLESVQGIHDVFVFTFRGKPIKEVKTAFQAACIRAGVGRVGLLPFQDQGATGSEYTGFTWHGFRHTWATWHVQNGTPLDVLQKLGGWSDLRMVMNYAHHSAGHLQQFADNATKEKS